MACLKRTYKIIFFWALLFPVIRLSAQSKSETYLFHLNPFNNERPAGAPHGRAVKVLIDFGLVSQFYLNDPNYTANTQGDGAYTIGVKLEIPVLKTSTIMVGVDYMNDNFDFNSYFFAPGYSILYDSNKIYNHAIELDEMQFPIEYKINFANPERNTKNFYATFGWVFRDMFYDNALVTNTQDGKFVWEGQDNITSVFHLFTQQCSSIIEASLGYQHNTLRSGNGWFFEVEYKYGISPYLYSGNNAGSNSVQFTLNTLSFKLGLRL